jgi:hypothetical protein
MVINTGFPSVCWLTFLLVHSEDDDNLVAADSDEFLDTTYTPSREFAKQDHAVDVVVLEEFYVCAHLCDLFQEPLESDHISSDDCYQPTCLTLTMTKLSTSGYFSS